MGVGNGYFNETYGYYQAKTNLTWDTYDAASSGNDWDSWIVWDGNNVTIGMPVQPELPLVYTTDIIDYGSIAVFNVNINVDATNAPTYTIRYGNTLESAGQIDITGTISVDADTTTVAPISARYVQIDVSVDTQFDSAGDTNDSDLIYMPYIKSINVELKAEQRQKFLKDINSSTLDGTVGRRTLSSDTIAGIGSISSLICQVHLPDPKYVAIDYVEQDVDSAEDDYISSFTNETPVIYVNKDSVPPELNIFDFDTYSHRVRTECVFDAIVTGLPQLRRDATGNLVEDL